MKNVLIINGHPVKDSFSEVLANTYAQEAAKKDNSVSIINVRDLDFNPNLEFGYKKRMEMEPDVAKSIKQIQEADHLVWVYPMWWYGMPAILKGFVDRTFLPDIAFRSRNGKLPEKLWKGKTARIILTADTPRWFDYIFMKSPALNQLKKGTLQFTGIKTKGVSYISPIKASSDKFRSKWIEKVKELGAKVK